MSSLLVVEVDGEDGLLNTDSEGLFVPGTPPRKFKLPPESEPSEGPPPLLLKALVFNGLSEGLDPSMGSALVSV